MDQLAAALEADGVILLAYVLMPNHYHLFVKTPHGNIQRFMQRLNTAYSMYHRFKQGDPGHLFQGRYGAKLVGGDDYVVRLTRYIHLNPVKVAAYRSLSSVEKIKLLNGYRWSSYLGYVDEHAAEPMVNYERLNLMHRRTLNGNRAEYRRYVERYIARDDEEFKTALDASRYAVGDERFIEEVESDLKDVRENKGVYGDIKWPEGKSLSVDVITAAVAKEFNLDKELFLTMSRVARNAKKVALELACRYSNQSQRKVGELFGYRGNGSVMKQRERLRELIVEDDGLKKRMDRIEKQLAKS